MIRLYKYLSEESIMAPDNTNVSLKELCEGLYLYGGDVNTGALVSGGNAVLFNCGGNFTPDMPAKIGADCVDIILCTQYRRSTASGAYGFPGAKVVAPKGELHLFNGADDYWADVKNRWHIYNFMPDTDVLPVSITDAVPVSGGDVVGWGDYDIEVIDTPGATPGGVSYIINVGGTRYCFCGDIIYEGGRLLNLYSLARAEGDLTGYHGFMASYRELISGVKRAAALCDVLVPPHGAPINDPAGAAAVLESRLESIYANYVSISSMNHYFPGRLSVRKNDKNGPAGVAPAPASYPAPDPTSGPSSRTAPDLASGKPPAPALMPPAPTPDMPAHILYAGATSYVVVSGGGAAFLIDCGSAQVVDQLEKWMGEGKITVVEGCWVTHYHDDHTDGLQALKDRLGTTVYCCKEMVDIIERPSGYFLPCISPVGVPVTATKDGETFTWREYTFTALHFPGQTLYHGGLLVEGRGAKVLFAGDSGSPSGLDDYCAQNRNFLGAGRGSRKTLELIRKFRPDYIINEHQRLPFRFGDAELDYMESVLTERETMYAALFPWPSPDYGLDEHWLRPYPYEQTARAGCDVNIELQATNHSMAPLELSARPIPPVGWRADDCPAAAIQPAGGNVTADAAPPAISAGNVYALPPGPYKSAVLPAGTRGIAGVGFPGSDAVISFNVHIPETTSAGKYIIPFEVSFGGRYLGWLKHAIINVERN